ncbi:response regulator [Ideonella sp. 4Y11]|uniref:histidine kinase n=1 Tax=Ideonella aquatica TaxID=2824119 RepID=A0A940YC34_9BURK|nr:ATP-binding protein [Ideonella aquatica]MBQ0957425.1 response regulator [Ideonella aquatica]
MFQPPRFQPSLSAASTTVDAAEIDRLIEADRIETLYANTPQALAGGVLFAVLLAWAFHPGAGPWLAGGWLLAKTLIIGLRALDAWLFTRSTDRRAKPRHWHHRHLAGVVIDGLTWGLAWPLFVPSPNLLLDGSLLAGLVGVAAIGVFTLTSHASHVVLFLSGVLLPIVAHELWQDRGDVTWLMAGGITIYFAVLLGESRRAYLHKTELLRLRFENAAIADERETALRRVEEASRAKSRFLATVSHELRTPLNGIMGMTELLVDAEPQPQARERLMVVQQSAGHLLTLIEDLLDVSRIEFGRFELHPEPAEPAQLVREVTGLLQPIAAARGLRLQCSIEPGVSSRVMLDAPRVRQVLHNLIGNALKFTEQGEVRLTLAQRGEQLQFIVTDSGRGIAPALLERIFEPFERGDDGRGAAGTGLGLTISRQLARAMGGNLVASSRPGQGAQFHFTLDAPAAQGAEPEDATDPQAPSLLNGEVLLVEDNEVNALVARSMLESLGLTVREARDGVQALQALQQQRPQVVLMDCQMPVLDGWEATRRWRQIEQANRLLRVPVVALTANAVAGDREVCLAAGMDDYLAKPFTRERLALVVARHLRRG